MATRVDNSKNMSKEDIKNVLINTFKRSAEKSVNQAAYDRTILATIQFCSDATAGQYKIKYQNSYFTAYAQDKSSTYINGASVYVLVPGNNMQNRMFITGLATNDNSQKISITSYDSDQQYMVNGKNLLKLNSSPIGMSSYINKALPVLYDINKPEGQNIITIDSKDPKQDILAGGSYIRFGASFKTNLKEYRKSGNYGIRLYIKYKKDDSEETEEKMYEINTFNMIGSPFNFSSFVPQYNYWEIPKDNFVEITRIETFREAFPSKALDDNNPDNFNDIFISDITLHAATKLYDSNNDRYKVEIEARKGQVFGEDDDSLPFKGILRIDGNPVEDGADKLECYWAKEDGSINNISNTKYNKWTGKGWYCLNTSNATKKVNATSVDDIKDNYTIEADDTTSGEGAEIKWNPSVNLTLNKNVCIGKRTKLKCVIIYENTPYEGFIEVRNPYGYYLDLRTSNGEKVFYGGGSTTITAGLFKDETGASAPTSITLEADGHAIKYIWTEIDEAGIEKSLPETNPQNILLSQSEWDYTHDNEDLSDEAVAAYLNEHPGFSTCIERYNYYLDRYNYYIDLEEPDVQKETTCKNRTNATVNDRITEIKHMYVAGEENTTGEYILGPSEVTGVYDKPATQEGGHINTTIPYYWGTQSYIEVFNTLYNLKINNIGSNATYKVTALKEQTTGHWQSIETQELRLENKPGGSLDYNLEIINGDQTFIYTVAGLAPTSKNLSNPVTLKPLFFRLYDKQGNLVFDSSNPDSEDNQTNITELHPIWTVPIKERSLVFTGYTPGMRNCYLNPDDNGTMIIEYQSGNFPYTLREEFNRGLVDNSNFQLQVSYDNQTVYATTHFSFSKQGDLGTNGTDMVLDIEDNTYREYKDGSLSAPELSVFNTVGTETDNENKKEYFYPNQRHLKNTYLYANKAYDDNRAVVNSISDATYVNLKFARNASSNSNIEVVGDSKAELRGYWYENGNKEAVDSHSKWSGGELLKYDKGQKHYWMEPCFSITPNTGEKTTASILYSFTSPAAIAYKPIGIDDYVRDGKTYKKRPNNIVRVEASKEVAEQIDPVTGNPIKRTNYGYYTIPYFYFSYYGNGVSAPETLDPARHIVIVDGFDEVIYDNAGYNPDYDKKPFRFFMFDKDMKDITTDVINGLVNGRTIITWDCSEGFKNQQGIGSVESWEQLNVEENLYGKYCEYQNKLYKCNHRYSKSQKVTIHHEGAEDEVYAAGAWVPQYWDEVNILDKQSWKYTVTPVASYNSLAASSLFNSWVSLSVAYTAADGITYEAQALLPINIICNKYGSEEINNWDGKKTKVDDAYIISNKVAAGVKNNDNSFTGITIGQSFYAENTERESEIGVFGYGHYDGNNNNPNSWARTIFMDANTGKTILGPSGASQIILNPTPWNGTINEEVWSRISGWYLSPNYFYKPVGEALPRPTDSDRNGTFTTVSQPGYKVNPGTSEYGSAGMYVPYYTEVNDNDTFIWASNTNVSYSNKENAKFRVTYGGKLYAQEADIQGIIRADKGYFGNDSTGIKINWSSQTTRNDLRSYPEWDSTQDNENLLSIDNYLNNHNEAIYCRQRYDYYNTQYQHYNNDSPTLANRTILVIGDSYTEGYTAGGTIDSWYDYFIQDHGSELDGYYKYALGGSGFAKPDKLFLTLLKNAYNGISSSDRLAVTDVLVAGGYNDGSFVSMLPDRIAEFARYAKQYFPNATLWISPFGWTTNNNQQIVSEAIEAYIHYGKLSGFQVLEGMKNVLRDNTDEYISTDQVHPTAEGYQALAAAMYQYLNPQLRDVRKKICEDRKDGILSNSENYILYNKNFWVKNLQGKGNQDVAVYMDGTIMARSGQFGQVGEDKDGDSNNTVFIEYAWYPWHLPADDEPWIETGENPTMYLDRTQGRNTTYALYHKNFFIKNNGDVFFNGKLFTESGRIGDWVITKTKLKSYDGGVEVGPSQIKLGAFTATADGALSGTNWWIHADGQASFTSTGNVFNYNTLESDGTGGELWIHDHDELKIGDSGLCRLYAGVTGEDTNYGMFQGNKFKFSTTEIQFTRDCVLKFAIGTYGNQMNIDLEGIHMVYQNRPYGFASSGELTCKTLSLDNGNSIKGSISNADLQSNSITVDGTTLETYIRNVTATMMVEAGALTSSNTSHDKTVATTDGTNIRPYYYN